MMMAYLASVLAETAATEDLLDHTINMNLDTDDASQSRRSLPVQYLE
jgi:hypothetical protein